MKENRSTTAERLKWYLREYNLTQADIIARAKPFCEKYGVPLSKQIMSYYVKGERVPAQNKLFILSKAMGVSPAWLMGLDVPMQYEAEAESIADVAAASADDPRMAKAIEKLVSLPEDKREVVYAMIDALSRN